MLSGLGPEDHLRESGVQVHRHLPAVGRNLDDHIQTCIIYKLNQSLLADDPEYKEYKKIWLLAKSAFEYGVHQTGMFAQPAIDSMGFFRSGLSNNSLQNDLQLYILADAKIYPIMELMEKFYGYSMPDPGPVPQMVILNAVQLHPESKGFVRLANSDPLMPPLIDPNFGATELDIK
uniref:Glucose-methanol-choline oxidoreductase N-terminal domain-containing protein n=1 Tax=Romanomermis culicivorax TaxID=13658 RepID=A0A915JEF3_ROMCU